MRIGVISDTHSFLDPQVPKLFTGVDHILHAGDVGLPKILFQLDQIAPVTAVLGNTDDPGFGYRLSEVNEFAGHRFLLRHIVNPHNPDENLQALLERARPDVVVFGHTHKPLCLELGSVLFFNPGYAGKSRFGMPRSVAILFCSGKKIRTEYFAL